MTQQSSTVSPFSEVLKMSANGEMKEYLMDELGKRRYQMGISQAEMASRLNISLRQYSNLKNGKSLCSIETLARFLTCSGINRAEFISGLVETITKSK